MSRVRALVVVAVAVATVLAGCGGDNSTSSQSGGEIFGRHPNSGSAETATSGSGVLLAAPAGTDRAALDAAAEGVRTRLSRMGVQVTAVAPQDGGIAVTSNADPYQLQAAARRGATTITKVTGATLGPCNGPGAASTGPAARCYTVGDPLTGVGAVATAQRQPGAGAGWKVTFTVDPTTYQAFRAPLEAAGQAALAVVSDGAVVLAFGSGVPALQSALGPGLTEEQARQAAAALVVNNDLPVALTAPALPAPQGARVDLDFWTAALGVKICGTWLPNAPPAGLDTGVHSHGDGLVYVHPFEASEAGDRATLGLFLQRGGWKATADRLELWDATPHQNGDACPGGTAAQVRWWVDGVEQHGNPGDYVPRNGQVIAITFGGDPAPPGAPPQMAALSAPTLSAAT